MSGLGRAALILYSKQGDKISMLLGDGARGLTTLGGRTKPKEHWIDCLVREVKEETRGILDYALCKKMFLFPPSQTVISDNCAYVFHPVDLSVLTGVAEQFPLTSSPESVCNEMSSLKVVDIDHLIEDLVVNEIETMTCNPRFKIMFMNVGYDTLRGNTFNFITENTNIDADLSHQISDIPPVICLTPINHGLPVVYGFSRSHTLFITDQFYFERDGRRLFRSGWHEYSD
jgi:8-oxo-dGTP pyrophosphatase MutT (NUDIX family)